MRGGLPVGEARRFRGLLTKEFALNGATVPPRSAQHVTPTSEPPRPDGAVGGGARPDDEGAAPRDGRSFDERWDPCDPLARHVAHLAPPPVTAAPFAPAAEVASVARATMSLEELVPALLKRIAWTGDRQRGTVRMEIGAGAFAGVTLIVHAEHGRVSVAIGAAGRADVAELRTRLGERLRARGIDVESIT